jgi:hypothetical protein
MNIDKLDLQSPDLDDDNRNMPRHLKYEAIQRTRMDCFVPRMTG